MVAFRHEDPAGALIVLIDDGTSLSDGARAAGDYDNSGVNDGNYWGVPYLTVQFDTTAPSVGAEILELYLLPGSAETTELYPDGGDAGLGTDDDPQQTLFVGAFTTVNPSITVDEILALPPIPLYPSGNRFVVKNVSGQTMDATWQLELMVFRTEDE